MVPQSSRLSIFLEKKLLPIFFWGNPLPCLHEPGHFHQVDQKGDGTADDAKSHLKKLVNKKRSGVLIIFVTFEPRSATWPCMENYWQNYVIILTRVCYICEIPVV